MKREELKAYNVVVSDECADYICGQNQLEFEAYAADDVDAVISEKDAENRKLKRALWLAREARAHDRSKRILRDAGIMFAVGKCHEWDILNSLQKKWQRVEDKCIKKAEEYK